MSNNSASDNHANQMNPNNDAFWQSRGWDERPDDWEELQDQGELPGKANAPANQDVKK